MSSEIEVKRSVCTMCGENCGVLVYVKQGKIVKISGNPENPVTRGFTCKRVAHAIHWLYSPEQLMHPLKRVGERGEGKWARITYEEALDGISEKLNDLKEKYGAHTVATSEGTLRNAEFWMRARFMNLFGSPNNFHPGVGCGLNREAIGEAIAGFRLCSKFGDLTHSRCLVVQAQTTKGFSPLVAQKLRLIRKMNPGKLRLIVIDPRDTGIINETNDIHLRIRPGTDAALFLAWINIIIKQKLYDKDFVEKYTFGFDDLARRAQEYPVGKVADITGIDAGLIAESARVFATNKPAIIFGGLGTDQIGLNATRVEQAAACLIAITGNIDIPGGRSMTNFSGIEIDGKRPLRDSAMELTKMLSDEQKSKQIGNDRFKLMSYSGYKEWAPPYEKYYDIHAPTMHTISASEPLIYQGIINGDPDRIRAIITWGSNPVMRTAESKLVYKAFKSSNLELSVVVDFLITPTAQLADYVMPCASWMERPYWTTWEDFAPACCFGEKAIEPLGERKDDYFFWRGLALRLGQEEYWPWETHEEVMAYRAEPIGYTYEDIIKVAGLVPLPEFNKYKKKGFATNTGKFELYSTVLEKLGYDPLPYFTEPPESPVSRPDLNEDYPLILITGGRSIPQYHSEYHQIGIGMRERRPNPIMDINTETARKLKINDGDWVYIETLRGRIKQIANVTDGIIPNVVNCEASWWYPEMRGEEPSVFGLWKSSANVLTLIDPDACDELGGGWPQRALLCRVYRA